LKLANPCFITWATAMIANRNWVYTCVYFLSSNLEPRITLHGQPATGIACQCKTEMQRNWPKGRGVKPPKTRRHFLLYVYTIYMETTKFACKQPLCSDTCWISILQVHSCMSKRM
jgi:hypothetical protein